MAPESVAAASTLSGRFKPGSDPKTQNNLPLQNWSDPLGLILFQSSQSPLSYTFFNVAPVSPMLLRTWSFGISSCSLTPPQTIDSVGAGCCGPPADVPMQANPSTGTELSSY